MVRAAPVVPTEACSTLRPIYRVAVCCSSMAEVMVAAMSVSAIRQIRLVPEHRSGTRRAIVSL
jgi:hypothetical protein